MVNTEVVTKVTTEAGTVVNTEEATEEEAVAMIHTIKSPDSLRRRHRMNPMSPQRKLLKFRETNRGCRETTPPGSPNKSRGTTWAESNKICLCTRKKER